MALPPNIMALLQGAMSGNPLTGPVPQQNLTPGFRAPGAPGSLGFLPRPQMPTPQIPTMGMRAPPAPVQPSTSGATMPAAENDGLGGAIAGIQGIKPNADGSFTPPPMPTDIGSGQGVPGSFWNWLQQQIGGSGAGGGTILNAIKGLF
jgi:hypothetical protein